MNRKELRLRRFILLNSVYGITPPRNMVDDEERYRIAKEHLGSVYGSAVYADTDSIKEEAEHGISDANNTENK